MESKIELFESCNVKIANYVLENIDNIEYRLIDDVNYNPKDKFIEYLQKIIKSPNGKMKIVYKNKNEERFFSVGYSMQSMLREFRHTLYNNTVYDIDIKNCHPVLLEQYCKKNNIGCVELSKFNKKRDSIFEKLIKTGLTKCEIKTVLLKIMNGGNLDETKYSYFKPLFNELKLIQDNVLIKNKDIEKRVLKEKSYNIAGSVLNHLLCKLENKVLMSCYRFFLKNNYEVTSLCFDGLTVLKKKEINDDILKALNGYVEKESEYKVEFIIKPMDDGMKIDMSKLKNYNDRIIIDNDEEGANCVIESLKNKIVKCNGRVFVRKYEDANIYVEDESANFTNTKEFLLHYTLKKNFQKVVKKKEGDELVPYSKDLSGAKNISQSVFVLIENNEDFVNKTWNSNLNKLCFLNGYYDFTEKAFKKYDEDTYTTVYINNNYTETVDEISLNVLYDKVLNPILHNKETQKRFLNWCARGLAGNYTEKTWGVGLGFRNSGKSVITDLFKNTFNSYIGTFNADQLLCNRLSGGDEAKKLSWLIPFQFRRLNFSNELKSVDENGKTLKLDGNQIKSVSSGGDEKTARKNYKDEIQFKLQGRMCLFMNDLIQTDPKDASETLQIFEFMSIFKKELTEENEIINSNPDCETKYFLKDDSIKKLIQDENIKKAFIKVIIDSYTDEPIIKNDVDEFIDDDSNVANKIKEIYNITLNNSDRITISDVNDYNKSRLSTISKSKIKQTLSSLGISIKSITENKKTTKYYIGLKLKEIQENNNNDF